jgi:hypothetical protein
MIAISEGRELADANELTTAIAVPAKVNARIMS